VKNSISPLRFRFSTKNLTSTVSGIFLKNNTVKKASYPPKSTTYLKIKDKLKKTNYNIFARGREVIQVKVEINVSAEAKEPYAIIYANEITAEVRRAATILESTDVGGVITVTENERIIVLRPDDVYLIRVENEKTVVYTKSKRYGSGKRLYEFEATIGNGFIRISKSALINLQYLDCVEPTLGGLMLVVLKNGCKDCISRKYLPAFKKSIGL